MVADGKRNISAGDEEQELEELFASYVDQLNRGHELNPQEILTEHPLVGEQLLACLEDYIGTDTAPTSVQLQTLGDYTRRRQIGRGGMGVVYDAWQNSLDRRVALKVLPVGVAADDRAFHRFMREAKTAARLNHENVVRVYGMGVESNTPYFAMEYVDGKTLSQLLAMRETETDEVIDPPFGRTKEGLVDYPRIATTFADVADGLHHAHSKGVIHRDIKPSNLILDSAGRLRILDFGLARLEGQAGLTLTHDVIGTPLYMSPEQARRRKIPIDHRTDIYSLGATLYEILTRRPPFRGEDNLETLSQIIANDPSPLRQLDPTIPKSFETIVLKCLRKNPKDRYDTAEAVADDLRRFVRGEPVEAQPLPPWAGVTRRAWKHGKRIGVIVMAAALIFLLVSLLLPTEEMVARRIGEGQLPYGRISPDGSYFTYVDWSTGDLAVTDVATGENRRLTDKGSWAESDEYAELSIVSPDGKQIAYAWSNGRFYEMRLVGFDGSSPRILYSHEDVEYLWPGAWSPDGKYVTATVNRADSVHQLVLISVADGSERVLKTVDRRFLSPGPFSPDGRYIVYDFPPSEESPQRDIFLLATDGSREVPVVEHPGNERTLAWTLDGEGLLFTSDRTGNTDVWAIRIRDGKPQGGPQLVKPNLGRISPLGFTSAGDFYYGLSTNLRDAYITPLDLETRKGLGTPTRVSQRNVGTTLWPRWSSNGKSLVYLALPNAQQGLWAASLLVIIRSLATGEERELSPELTLGYQFDLRPSLSPDEGSILLATLDKKGRQGIYTVDTRTAAVTPVVRSKAGTRVRLPAWSPDGETIFYLLRNKTDNRTTIVARDFATGRERNVYETRKPSKVSHFSISRDGRNVAFLLIDQTSRSTAIMVMPIGGGEPRKLLSVQDPEFIGRSTGLAWTPDGRNLLFRRGSADTKQPGDLQRPTVPADLWRIPVAGGEPERVGATMPGFLLGLHVHPDGQRIVFSAGGSKKELWVLENFLPAIDAARGK